MGEAIVSIGQREADVLRRIVQGTIGLGKTLTSRNV